MTLDGGKINTVYEVQSLALPVQLEKRLEALGMTVGTRVLVMNNKSHGTLIIKIRGTRLAIGRGIAQKIQVKG